MSPPSISFTLLLGASSVGTVVHVGGLASVQDDALVIEWRSSRVDHLRAVPRVEPGEIERARIPIEELEEIGYKSRLLGPGTFSVRTRSLRALDGIPGANGAFWAAKVPRGERRRARELAAELALRLAEARLRELGAGDAPLP